MDVVSAIPDAPIGSTMAWSDARTSETISAQRVLFQGVEMGKTGEHCAVICDCVYGWSPLTAGPRTGGIYLEPKPGPPDGGSPPRPAGGTPGSVGTGRGTVREVRQLEPIAESGTTAPPPSGSSVMAAPWQAAGQAAHLASLS